MAAERGLILVDTKYEFGERPDGALVLIDEIHTPDSSRYWYADSYAAAMARGADPHSLDKEFLRRWLVEHGFRGEGPPPTAARRAARRGRPPLHRGLRAPDRPPFEPDLEPPLPRLRRNLGLA
jgi:phosphoribosylaminoimidazole-succinocarboxamide synthase